MKEQDSSNERFSKINLRDSDLTSILPNTFSDITGNNYSTPINDNKVNEVFNYGKSKPKTKNRKEEIILKEVISQIAKIDYKI